jgi:hypothetical protein
MKRDSRLNNNKYNTSGDINFSNRDRENHESHDMVFAATSDAEMFEDDIWICESVASTHNTCCVENITFALQLGSKLPRILLYDITDTFPQFHICKVMVKSMKDETCCNVQP